MTRRGRCAPGTLEQLRPLRWQFLGTASALRLQHSQSAAIRAEAIAIARAILAEGIEEGGAIRIAMSKAKP
jgi:hypothetical protein